MGPSCGKLKSKDRGALKRRLTLEKKDMIQIKEESVHNYYTIGAEISSEHFENVFKCKSILTNKHYYAKIFSSGTMDPDIIKSFLQEVQLLREADHPNIIKVIDIFHDHTNAVVITEQYKGGELLERVQKEDSLNENLIAGYLKQMTSAVSYLHSQGVVHRDLRPESFMFLDNDKASCLKLINFGTCKFFEKDEVLLERIGSPMYMAPEVVFESYNEKCDIWSLGVILYLLLTGKAPFEGDSEEELMQNVMTKELKFKGRTWKKISAEAKDLLQHMLDKSVSHRYSAKDVMQHTFIVAKAGVSPKDFENLASTLRKLNKFETDSKLHRATLAFIVNQVMSADELGSLKNDFRLLDKDGDGILSKSEVEEAMVKHSGMSKNDFDELIGKVDMNGDGQINYSEFLTATINWENEMSRERLEHAFKMFDTDNSGTVSLEELQVAFGGSKNSKEVFMDMIKEADTNGDGVLDLEEFCNYMNFIQQKNIELRSQAKKPRYSNFY